MRFAECFLACLASVGVCQGQGIITTVAGSDPVYPGSSYSALSASFGELSGVAVSPVTGDVYFASSSRSLIVEFNPQLNSVGVVAGIGIGGYSGDGGPAANAALNSPQQIAFDKAGNLYIADDQNDCIRRIDPQGVITTVVKSPQYGATGVAFAPDGTVYFSDSSRIYHVSASGTVSVIAGGSQQGFSGDGGPAKSSIVRPQQPGVRHPWESLYRRQRQQSDSADWRRRDYLHFRGQWPICPLSRRARDRVSSRGPNSAGDRRVRKPPYRSLRRPRNSRFDRLTFQPHSKSLDISPDNSDSYSECQRFRVGPGIRPGRQFVSYGFLRELPFPVFSPRVRSRQLPATLRTLALETTARLFYMPG